VLSSPFYALGAPNFPSWPGPGGFQLTLASFAFGVLVSVLVLPALLYLALRWRHPKGKRWVQGYLEAAGVNLLFLLAAVLIVLGLYFGDPSGNRTSFAIYLTVLDGYWLAFAIPIVTVGTSVHSKTRGGVPWRLPSVVVSLAIFVVIFAYYYYYGIAPTISPP
jgi:hypothetical protein